MKIQKGILFFALILLHFCFVFVKGQNQTSSPEPQLLKVEERADRALERAIVKNLPGYQPETPDQYVRYYYTRVDLNGDGQPEALVYLVGQYVCGSGGCNLQIYQAVGKEYRLVSDITVAQTPIVVSDEKTSGWNNLLVHVSGGGARARYALLKFNGNKYPGNPTVQAVYKGKLDGKIFLKEDVTPDTGIVLKP